MLQPQARRSCEAAKKVGLLPRLQLYAQLQREVSNVVERYAVKLRSKADVGVRALSRFVQVKTQPSPLIPGAGAAGRITCR
jgi:hypothetical protein